LCEELNILYDLQIHTRAPLYAPESLKSIPGNSSGKSPFIEDSGDGITLSESRAIAEYIIHKHGDGRLAIKPSEVNYDRYLYWFHWTNATLQPQLIACMFPCPNERQRKDHEARLDASLSTLEVRLAESRWLAGDDFTAADIMLMYSVTTQRYWSPAIYLSRFPSLLRWIQDVAARPGYQRAVSIVASRDDPRLMLTCLHRWRKEILRCDRC
jgi:glutathione S-transferase